MKKVLFLLLVTSISYGQALFDKGIKITGGITTANDATKVVVQSANNVLNTIAKTDLIDAIIVNTTAELTGAIGNVNKLYATRDNTIIYRYNGTIYVPLSADVSGKEDVANKQNSLAVDGTNLKYPTVTAVNTGLATKLGLTGGTLTGNLNGTNLILSGDITVKPTGNFFIGDAIGQTGLIINATNDNATEAIRFFVNNNDAIFADYLGNVGVGTITPTEKLQVIGKATVSVAPTNPTDVVRKTELDLKANLASPSLTGTPTAPTAIAGTNTTQIATTAFVLANPSSNTVLLTGNQTINGTKTFTAPIVIPNATVFTQAVNKGQLDSKVLYNNQTVTANKSVIISEFVNSNHLILRVDTTAGNITITLPTFTALQGYKVTVKKVDSSANSVTITGVGAINIDGASTLVVSGKYSKATVGADLVQYIIL